MRTVLTKLETELRKHSNHYVHTSEDKQKNLIMYKRVQWSAMFRSSYQKTLEPQKPLYRRTLHIEPGQYISSP